MKKHLSIIALLLVFMMAFTACSSPAPAEPPADNPATTDSAVAVPAEKTKVGYIYIGPKGDAGWTYSHFLGVEAMKKALPNVEVIDVESVPESADSERVMQDLINKGCTAIFATSFGYMDFVQNVAAKNPDVKFFHCSGYKTAANVSTYFGQIEMPRYLTGMIAGSETKSNKIGYVAAFPIPEVIRGINAFTLGVRSVNKDAVVSVVWTSTWYDPAVEKDAAKSLLEAGCDVIAQHQDTPGPLQAAEEKGALGIGYNTDMSAFAPKAYLTSPVWNWGVYYIQAVQSVIDGTYESGAYWGSMADGVVGLAPMTDLVPADVKALVEAKVKEFSAPDFNDMKIFAGPLKDNTGKEMVAAGNNMTADEILNMMWFVEGVDGVIKQ